MWLVAGGRWACAPCHTLPLSMEEGWGGAEPVLRDEAARHAARFADVPP